MSGNVILTQVGTHFGKPVWVCNHKVMAIFPCYKSIDHDEETIIVLEGNQNYVYIDESVDFVVKALTQTT